MDRKRQKRRGTLLEAPKCSSKHYVGNFEVICQLQGRHHRHEGILGPWEAQKAGISKISWDGDVDERAFKIVDVPKSPYL